MPATSPISPTLAPWAARNSGTRPHASASLRLLTRPACEHARSAGSRQRRVGERLAQRRRALVAAGVALPARARRARRCRARRPRRRPGAITAMTAPADDEHVARRELRRQPAADRGGERDAAVAGRLVEAEREAAALGTDEVDLHHDRHRPRQALVDAEQDVGGDDPAPARGDGDQQRDGQRDRPAGDQQPPAAESLARARRRRGW